MFPIRKWFVRSTPAPVRPARLSALPLEDRTVPAAAFTPTQQTAEALFQVSSNVFRVWGQTRTMVVGMATSANPATAAVGEQLLGAFEQAPKQLQEQSRNVIAQLDLEVERIKAQFQRTADALAAARAEAAAAGPTEFARPQDQIVSQQQLTEAALAIQKLEQAAASQKAQLGVTGVLMDGVSQNAGGIKAALPELRVPGEGFPTTAPSPTVAPPTPGAPSAADIVNGLSPSNPNRGPFLQSLFTNALNGTGLNQGQVETLWKQKLISDQEYGLYVNEILRRQRASTPAPSATSTTSTSGSSTNAIPFTPPVVPVTTNPQTGVRIPATSGSGRAVVDENAPA